MSRRGEDEHHDQGITGGILPRGESMHTSRSHGAKDQPRHQQHDQNEHKKSNPNGDPKESYKRRTLIPLASQQNLERPRLVAHQADGCEEPPKLNDWPEHPVLPPNGSHGAFVFATVGEESCCAFERLPAD